MRVSIAAAKDELPKVLAGVDAITKNLGAQRPAGLTEPVLDRAANTKQPLPYASGQVDSNMTFENAHRARQQSVRPPTGLRVDQPTADRPQAGVSPLAGLK